MNGVLDWYKDSIRCCIEIEKVPADRVREHFLVLQQRYCAFDDQDREKILAKLVNDLQKSDLIWVLSVFVDYMNIEDFSNLLLEVCCEFGFENFFWNCMIEFQIRIKVKHRYVEKRCLRERNVKQLSKMLPRMEFIDVKLRNRDKIAIFVDQLLGDLHSPSKMAKMIAYTLRKNMGFEVVFFVFPMNYMLPKEVYYHAFIENHLSQENDLYALPYKDIYFPCYQVEMDPKECIEGYVKACALLEDMKPYFVLSLGAINPLVDCLNQIVDVVSINMSTELPPISMSNILIRKDKKDEHLEIEKFLNYTKQKQFFLKDRFPLIIEESECIYNRLDEGLPSDKFLITIVGNRLDLEIDNEFISFMKRLLDTCERIAFVFVGKCGLIQMYFENEQYKERIFFMGYREDLYATYKLFDLYLNPKRAGGGWSSMIALASGLPVLTLPEGDVFYGVGEEFATENYETMYEDIIRYATDQKWAEQKKQKVLEKYKKNTDENLIQYVSKITEYVQKVIGE